MKTIKVTVIVSNIDKWQTDWSNDTQKNNELMSFNSDIHNAIADHCGVNYSEIEITSEIIDK